MKTKKILMHIQRSGCLLAAAILLSGLSAFAQEETAIDYGQAEYWVYAETDRTDTDADIFFVNPTTYFSDGDISNMPIEHETAMGGFKAAIDMEKGIYDDNARFFAPYYRQAPLNIYYRAEEEWVPYLEAAYEDVVLAFEYYIDHYNQGRPIILAGFSQGADHCIRLMKDYYGKEPYSSQIIACYAIGWRLTD